MIKVPMKRKILFDIFVDKGLKFRKSEMKQKVTLLKPKNREKCVCIGFNLNTSESNFYCTLLCGVLILVFVP